MSPFNESTELMPRSSIVDLCNAYRQSTEEIRAAFAMIITAQNRLKEFFGETGGYSFDVSYGGRQGQGRCDFAEPEESIAGLHKQTWAALTRRLELRKILSLKRTQELDKQLETGEGLPPITAENVAAMLESNLNCLGQFLEEKIHEVYAYLRPERSQLKTNQKSVAAGLGNKVILSWAVEMWSSGYHVNHHRTDQLRAIDQVFHLLDGQPQSNDHYGELITAIQQQAKEGNDTFETPYFSGRCFRNHNLHLTFKRPDLVQIFNLVAGGMRLTDAKAQSERRPTRPVHVEQPLELATA